jgi:hypothetical protein
MATSVLPTEHVEIHPPLTSITPTNQTGIIAILTAFSLGLIILSALVRMYARQNTISHHSDDTAFYAAFVFGIAEVSLTLYLVSIGLGKAAELLDDRARTQLRNGEMASALLYVITLFLSKVSCALMLEWITPFAGQKRAAWILVGLSTAWLVAGLLAEGLGCHDFLGKCVGFVSHVYDGVCVQGANGKKRTRWLSISIMDMLLETALVGASVYMVWGRQMSQRAKYTVVGAFFCRIP